MEQNISGHAANSEDMTIEIINTGSELMLGRVLNTHQQWLCAELARLRLVVTRQVAIADSAHLIQDAVKEALQRVDLVIVTGGLGPTSDDITRDLIAQLIDRDLYMDPNVLKHVERFFNERHRRMPENAKVQAMVPTGAKILHNNHGTAPGLAIELKPNPFQPKCVDGWLIMLPGPPRELRPMFTEQVVPLLREKFLDQPAFICRTLRTTGLGESFVEEKVAEPLRYLVGAGLELGYCARLGEVDVRLVASGTEAGRLVHEAELIIRNQIKDYIFGTDDDSLESVVVQALVQRKQTLALAESCTGGSLAHRITNIPGASAVFRNGFVTYSNESKVRLLDVKNETLEQFGAVSEQTAREMAEGARTNSKTDFALSITGIAGPSGGSDEKPVGTVFIGLATETETKVERFENRYDRETFKFVTTQQALNLLRRALV